MCAVGLLVSQPGTCVLCMIGHLSFWSNPIRLKSKLNGHANPFQGNIIMAIYVSDRRAEYEFMLPYLEQKLLMSHMKQHIMRRLDRTTNWPGDNKISSNGNLVVPQAVSCCLGQWVL